MVGRDPHEPNRVATPLELLYDLTFAVAFSTAGAQAAGLFAEGHLVSAIVGFALAMFAINWAWINYAWFASAFDCDDWLYRLTTMVQMVGVVIMAIGLPATFGSIDAGTGLDLGTVVLGYVVMRIGLVSQWLRAARQSKQFRSAALTYVVAIALAQVGWIALALAHPPLPVALVGFVVLLLIEVSGPIVAERRKGGTPWHPHHIAERYSLLAIITLGEGVIGTVATLGAVVHDEGWTMDAALVVVAGTGLTFGMWWVYFVLPSAPLLERDRSLSFGWGYGHVAVFAALAATGAGLHVTALLLEHEAVIPPIAALLALAVPVAVYLAGIYALYGHLASHQRFHSLLLVLTALVLAAAVGLVLAGVEVTWALPVVAAAPFVTVVGYELYGHRHAAAALSGAA